MGQDLSGCCDGNPHFLVFETGCVRRPGVRPHPEPLERVHPESFACIKRPFFLNPTMRAKYRTAIKRLLHNTLCPSPGSESRSQPHTVQSIIRMNPTPCSVLVFTSKKDNPKGSGQAFLCEVMNTSNDKRRTLPRAKDTRGLLFAPGRYTVPLDSVTPRCFLIHKNHPVDKIL